MRTFTNIINQIIPNLPAGIYMARDFFGNDSTSPGVVRRFYEETLAGNISRVTLIGNTSAEGYQII